MRDITYAAIVPLIGGEHLGIRQALDGQLPEYVLSYKPFAKNDAHYVNYLREKGWAGDYVFLDENPTWRARSRVDVIAAVCPCAGLSALSMSSHADSAVNDWMYVTTERVLSEEKPRVFWGENAPRLFTKAGKKVADRLAAIGLKHGYKMALYYTESRVHGLAQKRPRTFYFFYEGDKVPVHRFIERPLEPIEKIMQSKTEANDPMNRVTNKNNPMDDGWLQYCMHKSGVSTIKDYYDTIESTVYCVREAERHAGGNFKEIADWFDSKGYHEKFSTRAKRIQGKLDDGLGYWGRGTLVPKNTIPSLISGIPFDLVNIFAETPRYPTLRECLRIMKMPDDFNLVGENPVSVTNHICQNVPVTTAADMMGLILDHLNGECDYVSSDLVKQNNVSRKTEYFDGAPSLEEFMEAA